MWIETIVDPVLFVVCICILLGSAYITVKTRFIQITFIPALYRMIKGSITGKQRKTEGAHTVKPYKALFTAMSTTLGIGTIVGPVIAMNVGGPGALLGFLLTACLGSAATYIEVLLSLKHREKRSDGTIAGGPMPYLKKLLSPFAAKWYAVCGCMLMTAWSAAQANQLAAILNSPLLGDFSIPTAVSGIVIAALVVLTLIGGIKRISAFSAKLVPTMFTLYLGACLWILAVNYDKIGDVLAIVFQSAFSPYAMASGAVVGGVVSALRWGVFKGTQVTEAGVGTQTIPHSMAETTDSTSQAMLAMVSTYTAGIVSFISGCVALITGTWEDPALPLGISMVAASFQSYFSYFGVIITAVSAILFAFGTILGNGYNGSQCFSYIASRKKLKFYYLATALMIFLGTIGGVKVVWSVIDLGLACLVLPHMAALVLYVAREKQETKEALMSELTSTSSS